MTPGLASSARDLAALLRGIVLVGQPALGERLDLQRVSLGSVSGGDQLVMRALRLREPSGSRT